MTEKYSRAQRRADRARIKIKRQFHWGYGHKQEWWKDNKKGEINYMSPLQAGIIARTSTVCSCWMCGNPRRGGAWTNDFGPLTLQEYKALDNYKDYLGVYDEYHPDDFREDCYWIDEHYEWEQWQYRKVYKILEKIWFT